MTSYTYEVTVSEQHWLEGCDFALAPSMSSQCCPVYRAMCEAGLPVERVHQQEWYRALGDSWPRPNPFPVEVQRAIGQFDDFRMGETAHLPAPITFTVELSE